MGTATTSSVSAEDVRSERQPRSVALVPFAILLAVLGVVGIWPTAIVLYGMWMTDPLKSIGMLVPIVSMALILSRWRYLRWEMNGSWWGLVILIATAAAVRFREQSVLVLILSPRWSIFFPPHSLVALAYVAGVVLLFGGWPLLRAARFPVLLVLLVNPVPHIFNVYVDLPLQRVSAHVARAFAIALHQKLTPDQMRLMFTPDFGMFIAPGCNGIRGAVTMGMIALILGHLYRFRWRAHLLFVVGAILLGYVFNFVRLCTLVLYYIVALKIPWLQDRAEMGDYIIGATLFFAAIGLLFIVIRHEARSDGNDPALAVETLRSPHVGLSNKPLNANDTWGSVLRVAAMTVFVIFAASRVARGVLQDRLPKPASAELASFPKRLGDYTLIRSWPETVVNGPLIFEWADYAPAAGGGPHVAVGISPILGSHDTSICHSARGEDPVWHGELQASTAAGPESFSSSFFNNGATQYLEVTTVCAAGGCGEYSAGDQHFGLIYSRPAPAEAFSRDQRRPIPVMLRVETLDTAMPAELARRELTDAMRKFLASADLPTLTRAYR